MSVVRSSDVATLRLELRSDPWIINYTHIERAYIYLAFCRTQPLYRIRISRFNHTYTIYKLNEYPHLYMIFAKRAREKHKICIISRSSHYTQNVVDLYTYIHFAYLHTWYFFFALFGDFLQRERCIYIGENWLYIVSSILARFCINHIFLSHFNKERAIIYTLCIYFICHPFGWSLKHIISPENRLFETSEITLKYQRAWTDLINCVWRTWNTIKARFFKYDIYWINILDLRTSKLSFKMSLF